MSKYNNQTDQILLKVMPLVTNAEFKVFTAWFSDSLSYNATSQILSDRTGINRSDCSRYLKSMETKGILVGNGKQGRIAKYKLSDSILSKKEVENDVKECLSQDVLVKKETPNYSNKVINAIKEQIKDKEVREQWITSDLPEEEMMIMLRMR